MSYSRNIPGHFTDPILPRPTVPSFNQTGGNYVIGAAARRSTGWAGASSIAYDATAGALRKHGASTLSAGRGVTP